MMIIKHSEVYRHRVGICFLLAVAVMWTATVAAGIPAGGTSFKLDVYDTPNDNGSSVTVDWNIPAVFPGIERIHLVFADTPGGPFQLLQQLEANHGTIRINLGDPKNPDDSNLPMKKNVPYYYRIQMQDTEGAVQVTSPIIGPVTGTPQWFHQGKLPVFISVSVFFALVVLYIQIARRRGSSMYVRPIAGMSEIDNAIGRATEMGRPILYVLGLGGPDEIATIASYTILARVARKTAEYRTELIVPCNEPIVMTIAQETVKNAYAEAGHSDAYNDNMVYYITSMQFAYVAAVNGLMLRERTATNCYFGKFYAESLLLSETGNIAGSIQVAGTDEVAQLPFFITTCDYTLIGEELYAASAYLGRDPLLLGSLKAQDFAKAVVMLIILFGTIFISFGYDFIKELVTVTL